MDKKIILGKAKPKPKGKAKRSGRLIIRGGPLFAPIKIKDECFRPLTEQSRALAEKAWKDGLLEDLDGKLRCECGAAVGVKKASMGEWLEPTRHPTYKPPRRLVNPSGKPGYYKRA
jgi:hypothetical protein